MLWDQRLRRGLEEPAERRAEIEPDRAIVERRHLDLSPRGPARAFEVRVLERVNREYDVGRGDRHAVLPRCSRPNAEGVLPSGLIGRPLFRQIWHDLSVGAEAGQPAEDERDEVSVGLSPGCQRVDRARSADDAFSKDWGP